jgi:immunoglobulin I-set domain protein
MPIRVRPTEPPPAPVQEQPVPGLEPLPPIEPEAPWPERESAAPAMPFAPEPPAVSRERNHRTPSPSYSAPQPQPVAVQAPPVANSGYGSVPFAAEPGLHDAPERRKLSPVLIGAVIVAIIAIAGIVWMVHSSMTFGGNAAPVTITIYPTAAKVAAGKGIDFVAEVSGAPTGEVTWSAEEGDTGGEIRSRGASAKGDTISLYCTYTAPQKPGTYHLVATSTADKTKSATAEIMVTGKEEPKGH